MNCNKEYDNKKCGGRLKRMKSGINFPSKMPLYFCDNCGHNVAICESGNYVESIIYSESIPIKLHK